MLIKCTNKGCFELTEAKLNVSINEVFCEKCEKSISGLTKYTIKTLQLLKQIVKKPLQAFDVLCQKCKKNVSIVIKGNKAFCSVCENQLNVTPAFIHAKKMSLEEDE
jgi:hypothetical protein